MCKDESPAMELWAMTEDKEKYRAPALDKGLDILELLATQPAGLTRSQIVKALGRGPSEIYRMLERLVVRGYVGRSFDGDRYSLTIKLFQLGASYPPYRRLVDLAQPLMDQLANESQQSVHLAVPDLGQTYVIAHASSRAAWEFRMRIGAELDLFRTGSGLTLLAFLNPEQQSQMLAFHPDVSPAILTELEPELSSVRKRGYREGKSNQIIGVMDISVPVFAASQEVVGVLTCPFLPLGEKDNVTYKTRTEMRERLRDLAGRLST